MLDSANIWREMIGVPTNYDFEHKTTLINKYEKENYIAEIYRQANGPETTQKVIMLLTKNAQKNLPAIVVPFYFPEALMGFDIETGEELHYYKGIEMLIHLVRRGYAVVSAESFHLTYLPYTCDKGDFSLWDKCASALLNDHPKWTGIGKLVSDTILLIDFLENDNRINKNCLGIAGHSLGGKIAFYTGCLDERIKVILASDFGFCFHQSNWHDKWYWGKKLEDLKAAGQNHADLLGARKGIPFCLIAGEFDNDESYDCAKNACGYDKNSEKLKFINHASGHRPPWKALSQGYDFLDMYLKS